MSLGKAMLLVFAIIAAMPVLLFASRPTDCQALEAVFRSSAVSDGFSSFDDFAAEKIVVETRIVGLGWQQKVVYPNPQLSKAFNRPTATEIAVDQSLFLETSVNSSLNIPLDELDTKIARQHSCAL